ncbi:MAG: hypothetical protein M5U33_12645 [Pseudorhodoplanes sp.]|nr:hypothetical protein [Pseudorhodoplanes sp.]
MLARARFRTTRFGGSRSVGRRVRSGRRLLRGCLAVRCLAVNGCAAAESAAVALAAFHAAGPPDFDEFLCRLCRGIGAVGLLRQFGRAFVRDVRDRIGRQFFGRWRFLRFGDRGSRRLGLRKPHGGSHFGGRELARRGRRFGGARGREFGGALRLPRLVSHVGCGLDRGTFGGQRCGLRRLGRRSIR